MLFTLPFCIAHRSENCNPWMIWSFSVHIICFRIHLVTHYHLHRSYCIECLWWWTGEILTVFMAYLK
jgi:hypothetical protein